MNQSQNTLSLQTLKMIWGALTFSILIYGFVISTNRGFVVSMPDTYTLFEKLALAYNMMFVVTFLLHEKFIKKEKDPQKRGSFYVICWALHESVAVMAFAAVFINPESNVFVYEINATMAVLANLITFPRAPQSATKDYK